MQFSIKGYLDRSLFLGINDQLINFLNVRFSRVVTIAVVCVLCVCVVECVCAVCVLCVCVCV